MTLTRSLRRVSVFTACVAAVCVACVTPAAAQSREGAFERTLKVSGSVDLSVQSGSGHVRVQPGPVDSVRVSARLKADDSLFSGSDVEQRIRKIEQNPPIEQQGNTIRIGRFEDENLPRNISISYDVTVPADARVAARTGSGGIDIGVVKGAVSASTGSGSVQVDGAASLDARTGSGSVRATAITGNASAKTGSGSVTLALTGPGEVEASAGSGSITVTGVNGAARVSSGSGGVTIDGRPAGPWSLHSSSGGVTMTLPPDAAFSLDARTSSGSIVSDHEVTMTVTGKIDKHHIAGKVRGGGPLVEASCASGSIRIK